MVKFQEIQPYNLDLSTGSLTDFQGNLVNFGSTPATDPMASHKAEASELLRSGIPLNKILKAVNVHPEISSEDKHSLIEFIKTLPHEKQTIESMVK